MENNVEANAVDSTEPLVEKSITAVTIYDEHRAKMKLIEQRKEEDLCMGFCVSALISSTTTKKKTEE